MKEKDIIYFQISLFGVDLIKISYNPDWKKRK